MNGAIAWSASYTAFGQASVEIETVTNNLRFPGQYYDAETGLHYNYFRYYNSGIGRYLKTDPIGLKGGINFFTYAKGHPINYYDNLGLVVGYLIARGNVRDGLYGWNYQYSQNRCVVEIKIKLVGFAISNALVSAWEQGVESKWSHQFACCDPGGINPNGSCCKGFCTVTVDVEFVNLTGIPLADVSFIKVGEDYVVNVGRGPFRSNMTNWDSRDPRNVAAHEVGHMLGIKDEYPDALVPNRSPINTGTVMDTPQGPPVRRHYKNICRNIGKVPSTNFYHPRVNYPDAFPN